MLGEEKSEPLLDGDPLPAVLVLWGEPGGVGAEGGVTSGVGLGHGVHPLVGLVHVVHHVHPVR